MTGTYIFQTNRVVFNQNNQIDPTCMLCKSVEETLRHFLLQCETFDCVRHPILRDLKYRLKDSNINFSDKDTLIHIITDCTAVVDPKIVGEVISLDRRLCYACTYREI